MDQAVHLVTVATRDLDAARRFYEALGWTAQLDVPGEIVFYRSAAGQLLGFFAADAFARDAGAAGGSPPPPRRPAARRGRRLPAEAPPTPPPPPPRPPGARRKIMAEVIIHVAYSMLNFSIRDGQEHTEAVIELKRLLAAYLLSAEKVDA